MTFTSQSKRYRVSVSLRYFRFQGSVSQQNYHRQIKFGQDVAFATLPNAFCELEVGTKKMDFSGCNFNLMTYKLLAVTKRAAYFNVYGHSWIFRMLSIIRTELPTALKKVTSDFRNFFMVNILQISASRVNDQFTFFSFFEVMHCGYEKRRNCVELYNMKTRKITFTFFLDVLKTSGTSM